MSEKASALRAVSSPDVVERTAADGGPRNNPGTPLELDWLRGVQVNKSAIERRTATLTTRRTVKKAWQAAWLLHAVRCMDLTTLSGDDTPGRVERLCAKARSPVRRDLLADLGVPDLDLKVGAVCVYHQFVKTAVDALRGSGIPVAAVSTGFPAGLSPFEQRVAEIGASVAAGAEEIDIVITRSHVLTQNWPALYEEVRAFRAADDASLGWSFGPTPRKPDIFRFGNTLKGAWGGAFQRLPAEIIELSSWYRHVTCRSPCDEVFC